MASASTDGDAAEEVNADGTQEQAATGKEEPVTANEGAASPGGGKAVKPASREKAVEQVRKVFICEGQSCDLVRRIFNDWGWEENSDPDSKRCDLKWTFRSRDAEKMTLDPWQLVNHFRGSYFLSNKAFLGQCLQRCEACAMAFFPRQHDLRNSAGLRTFLRDFVTTAAEQALLNPAHDEDPKEGAEVSASEAAARVLRRRKDWDQRGDAERSERLLCCAHECTALFGQGCLLPSKVRLFCRPHVSAYSSSASQPLADCSVCSEGNVSGAADVSSRLRQDGLDGLQNVWALKEPCVQKGKGVTVLSGLAKLLEDYEQHAAHGQGRDCVAQKYIERPLLIQRAYGPAKCDLRVWVLVMDWNPLTAFVHPEVYFRVATKPYTLDTLEPNAHKTNCRDEENRTPMKVLFQEIGEGAEQTWSNKTWPRLLDAVRAALIATRDAMAGCEKEAKQKAGPRAFELFGLDFAIDETWRPWLLEMNTSPCMLDDCVGDYEKDIKDWAWEATDSLLKLVLAHHAGALKLPSVAELQRQEPEDGSASPERLFDPDVMAAAHSERCPGAAVAAVPRCLASGLSLGGPCGRWRLIIKERSLDELQLRRANEDLLRRNAQAPGSRDASAARLLREWLLPVAQGASQPAKATAACSQNYVMQTQLVPSMSKTSAKLKEKRKSSQAPPMRNSRRESQTQNVSVSHGYGDSKTLPAQIVGSALRLTSTGK